MKVLRGDVRYKDGKVVGQLVEESDGSRIWDRLSIECFEKR